MMSDFHDCERYDRLNSVFLFLTLIRQTRTKASSIAPSRCCDFKYNQESQFLSINVDIRYSFTNLFSNLCFFSIASRGPAPPLLVVDCANAALRSIAIFGFEFCEFLRFAADSPQSTCCVVSSSPISCFKSSRLFTGEN